MRHTWPIFGKSGLLRGPRACKRAQAGDTLLLGLVPAGIQAGRIVVVDGNRAQLAYGSLLVQWSHVGKADRMLRNWQGVTGDDAWLQAEQSAHLTRTLRWPGCSYVSMPQFQNCNKRPAAQTNICTLLWGQYFPSER